ncbi:MAG: serine O-acetyltransferase [Methylococcales bacterium]|nr:serine O-acetyltransferase [Methylococcales bacterium]MCK5925732.1 serine O-acetyltransferase [Methylococcales bacterium]
MLKRLKSEISCVFERDPAAQSVFEVCTCYPGFHAVLIHRVSHKIWQANFKWMARFIAHCSRWMTGIEIHPAAKIGQRFFIDHGMGVVIGETAIIGDDCTLYHGVTLGGTSWQKGKRHPTLGNGVVVGAGAKVLGPIEVGENARVGSNAVVVKAVPAGATVTGIPGRIRKAKTLREKTATKIGFEAYGETANMPDPIVEALNRMLDHIEQTDQQMQCMRTALKKAGIDCKEQSISKLKVFE